MPSQASTRKSSSSDRVQLWISGAAVIICSCGGILGFNLKSKSPNALVKFKAPFTRPSMIVPPARVMRSASTGREVLWSKDMSTALPRLARTHLESPAFATNSSLSRITATTAVHPALHWYDLNIAASVSVIDLTPRDRQNSSSADCFDLNNVSILIKASCKDGPIKPDWNLELTASSVAKCLLTKSATSFPPCPSNTPKQAVLSSTLRLVKCASSMELLHPCMLVTANLSLRLRPELVFFSVSGLLK
mmetsp:Transcript_15836/g.29011  ORF Transcript_15836/g.29011 Transcript_15836/m.29011 type:complete len:248 (+) Transcript_15836:193-936(+)